MEKPRVLVIEDNHELGESLEDILSISGYDPHISLTGKEGLEHALEHHPDLIILDIRLPDMNGYEIYHQLQKDSWGKKAKVLVLTASESLENISKNIDLPIEHILFKPELSVRQVIEHVQARLTN